MRDTHRGGVPNRSKMPTQPPAATHTVGEHLSTGLAWQGGGDTANITVWTSHTSWHLSPTHPREWCDIGQYTQTCTSSHKWLRALSGHGQGPRWVGRLGCLAGVQAEHGKAEEIRQRWAQLVGGRGTNSRDEGAWMEPRWPTLVQGKHNGIRSGRRF